MDISTLTQNTNLARLKHPEIAFLTQIQPHGVLVIARETDLTILQISKNSTQALGLAPDKALGKSLAEIFDTYQVGQLKTALERNDLDAINPIKMWASLDKGDYSVFDASLYRMAEGLLVLELEPAIGRGNIPFLGFYHLAKASIGQLESAASLADFYRVIVREVRAITDFDRVMLYRFDNDGNGEVVAEEQQEGMESYLGLRFPESDIPKTARKMFLSNWIRVIPDSQADPVDIYPACNPDTQRPLDLTLSILRSPHSCHREYLHNMEVRASLTISLMKDGKLWGLIACHHRAPKFVPYELRKACEFLGRVIFSEISTREETSDYHRQIQLAHMRSRLIERVSEVENFADGLIHGDPNLLDLVDAQGAAICYGGSWATVGNTPSQSELELLGQWLAKTVEDEVFHTDSLPLLYSEAERYKHVASGLLAIPISKRSFVMWFRPEVIQTVEWGGDPNHAYELLESEHQLKLCPRKSFSLWKETVRLTSLPWTAAEIESTLELRKAIVNVVLRQAEELTLLARDLERSNAELKKFAYVASHDLQEPLNQVANFVQLLELRYGQKLDGDAIDYINFAVDGVSLMQTLIDDVLTYSKVDIQGVAWELTSVDRALQQALNNLRQRIEDTDAEVTFDAMPTIVADGTQLMQLFQNLIGNAIKFRRPEVTPQIAIGVERREDDWLFSIRDNGIGIDEQFIERVFVIFQRLHTRDEYPGSGMGLAICKKIVECHRGRIWFESDINTSGTTFYFTIPVGGRERDRDGRRRAQNYLAD